MRYLKQSTASQEVSLGYFVDSTDGDTEETGLTIANTDIKIRKGGATTLANKNSGGATHISNGIYYATLDATDTDTLGMLEIYVHVSGALAVKDAYMVLPSASYDALITNGLNDIAATDIVSAGAITTLSGAIVNVDLVDTLTTYTGNTVQTGDSYARIGAPAGASVSADVAAVKTDTAAVLVDTGTSGVIVATNNDKTGYSISGTKTTLDGLNDVAATDIVSSGAITTSGGAVSNVTTVATTTTNTDMRGTDSALLASSAPTNFGDLSITASTGLVDITQAAADKSWTTAARTVTAATNITSDGSAVTMSSSGVVGTVNLANTATAVTNRVTANADQVNGDATAAANLAKSAIGIATGAAIAGTLSTTQMTTDLTEATDDHYNGRIIVFTSGVLLNQATDITDYTGATKLLTFTALTEAPTATDTFVIV